MTEIAGQARNDEGERRDAEDSVPYILTEKAHSAPRIRLQTQSLHRISARLCCKMYRTIILTTCQAPARWGCP
jgi:hypothetical protein